MEAKLTEEVGCTLSSEKNSYIFLAEMIDSQGGIIYANLAIVCGTPNTCVYMQAVRPHYVIYYCSDLTNPLVMPHREKKQKKGHDHFFLRDNANFG